MSHRCTNSACQHTAHFPPVDIETSELPLDELSALVYAALHSMHSLHAERPLLLKTIAYHADLLPKAQARYWSAMVRDAFFFDDTPEAAAAYGALRSWGFS